VADGLDVVSVGVERERAVAVAVILHALLVAISATVTPG
jgi:hypothetical protein